MTTLEGLLSAGYNTYVSGDIGSAGSAYTSDSQAAIAAGGNVYLQNSATPRTRPPTASASLSAATCR